MQTRTYLLHMSSPIMKLAYGLLHKGGQAASGGPPIFVKVIMGDEVCIESVCALLYILSWIIKTPGKGNLMGFHNPGRGEGY